MFIAAWQNKLVCLEIPDEYFTLSGTERFAFAVHYVRVSNNFYFQVGNGRMETNEWQIPGFKSGLAMTYAENGKILWDEVKMGAEWA